MIILAVVLAKGIGVTFSGTPASVTASATGDFANGNISQQPLLIPVLSAELPESPSITGVNIKSISGNTKVGQGRLQLNGGYPDFRLSWFSPDADGTSVTVPSSVGVEFAAGPSEPQIFTLTSETTGETDCTITVEVAIELLPRAGMPYVNIVTISQLYEDDGAVFSATDQLHRDKVGSYVPREDNPHGLGYSDLTQPVAIIPRPIVAGSDILQTGAEALLARITTNRPSGLVTDRTLIWQSAGGDSNTGTIRAYALHSTGYELCFNARWNGQWNKDVAASSMLWRYENNGGFTEYRHTTTSGPWSDSAWSDTIMPNKGFLSLGVGRTTTTPSDQELPRLVIDRGGGATGFKRTLMLQSDASAGANIPIRIYAVQTTIAEDHPHLEFTLNARWEADSEQWYIDYGTSTATRVAVSYNGFRVATHSGAAPWSDAIDDTNWKSVFWVGQNESGNYVHGQFSVQKQLIVGELQAANDEARIITRGQGYDTRTLVQKHVLSNGINYRKYYSNVGGAYTLEETLGCYWDSTPPTTTWRSDGGYSATIYQWTDGGLRTYTQDGGMSSGSAISGFTDSEVITLSTRSAYASTFNCPVRVGAVASSPLANTIYRHNIPKAWGALASNTNCVANFNVASVEPWGYLDRGVWVTFSTALNDGNFAVVAQREYDHDPDDFNLHGTELNGSDGNQLETMRVIKKTATGFGMYIVRVDGTDNVRINPITNCSFIVFGVQ